MWTYLFGPIVAIFPKPWRRSNRFVEIVQWEKATAISGFVEAALALVALGYWYIRAMSVWVGNGAAVALSGKMGTDVRIQDIGGAALIVWWMHPVTWLLAFFGLEGIFRLCAGAFGDNSCGIFPLFLIDKIVFSPFRQCECPSSGPTNPADYVSSYMGAIRDRIRKMALPEVSDELRFTKNESGEILEILASRKKQDWIPPRVVRYQDGYYRLEEDSMAGGARPFCYRLRRLAAGVPGRTVLTYAPAAPIIRTTAKVF